MIPRRILVEGGLMERANTPLPFFNGDIAESVFRVKIVLLIFAYLELN